MTWKGTECDEFRVPNHEYNGELNRPQIVRRLMPLKHFCKRVEYRDGHVLKFRGNKRRATAASGEGGARRYFCSGFHPPDFKPDVIGAWARIIPHGDGHLVAMRGIIRPWMRCHETVVIAFREASTGVLYAHPFELLLRPFGVDVEPQEWIEAWRQPSTDLKKLLSWYIHVAVGGVWEERDARAA